MEIGPGNACLLNGLLDARRVGPKIGTYKRTWRQIPPLLVRHRESERHGVSAFLRGVCATFFGKAQIPTHCECNASIRE